MFTRRFVSFAIVSLLAACSSTGKDDESSNPGEGGAGGNGGTGMGKAGSTSKAGGAGIGVPPHTGPEFAGAGCPDDLGLPDAYALPNVRAVVQGSNARISFDPQGDAKDYRVYVLPAADDISGTTVTGATYRCAGRTAVPGVRQDESAVPNGHARTRVESMVNGFARTTDDATLGYVFTTPADDRVPVYTMGDPHIMADTNCYFMRWAETRVKKYVTSEAEREELLAARWRDDGIAFYVPKDGADGTHTIYSADDEAPNNRSPKFYLKDGPERDKRAAGGMIVEPAFSVYSEQQEGSEPLLRVFYELNCGRGHDELVAGVARFNTAYAQGDQPVTELHYSGLTEETTLVVEALDDLCPFPGMIAPMSRAAQAKPRDGQPNIKYPAFETPDELRAASSTGELFVGGQGDGTAPKAISRACVKVEPEALPDADFRYSGEVETFTEPEEKGFQIWELESPTFNVQFHSVETDEYAVGSLFNELWVTYADWAADTNGKMRLTPKARATLADDAFVHATMEVDVISSQRRYPQLLISDVEWPVQDNLPQGGTVITQIFGGITQAMQVQLEFCDRRTWDVNNQCPKYNFDTVKEDDVETWLPHPEVNAFFGIDRTVMFDVYVSTSRAYVFTNGMPYGCADLPPGRISAGPATVTFGDVIYHSAVDLEAWYPFHLERLHYLTSRHFSNLSFTSGVMAPAWDEARMPCVPASGLQ
jgi:hypothetical protein